MLFYDLHDVLVMEGVVLSHLLRVVLDRCTPDLRELHFGGQLLVQLIAEVLYLALLC